MELKLLKSGEKSSWDLEEEPLKGRRLGVSVLIMTFREDLIFFFFLDWREKSFYLLLLSTKSTTRFATTVD